MSNFAHKKKSPIEKLKKKKFLNHGQNLTYMTFFIYKKNTSYLFKCISDILNQLTQIFDLCNTQILLLDLFA